MDYEITFGNKVGGELRDVMHGCEFDSNEPMATFEHYAYSKHMSGGDFSDCDYIVMYRNDHKGGKEMVSFKMLDL